MRDINILGGGICGILETSVVSDISIDGAVDRIMAWCSDSLFACHLEFLVLPMNCIINIHHREPSPRRPRHHRLEYSIMPLATPTVCAISVASDLLVTAEFNQ